MNIQMFEEAFYTKNPEKFVELVCPPEWSGLKQTILLICDDLSFQDCKWFPGSGKIPLTLKGSTNEFLNMAFRSVVFRFHDILHQLWPAKLDATFTQTQIDGEIVVLTIAEVYYIDWILRNTSCPILTEYCFRREVAQALPSLFENDVKLTFAEVAYKVYDLVSPYGDSSGVVNGLDELFFSKYFKKMIRNDHRWSLVNSNAINDVSVGEMSARTYGDSPFNDMVEDVEQMLSGKILPVSLHKQLVLPKQWK